MPEERVIYAVYKGEEFICSGTASECAKHLAIKRPSFKFLLSPSYLKRIENRQKTSRALIAFRIDDEY